MQTGDIMETKKVNNLQQTTNFPCYLPSIAFYIVYLQHNFSFEQEKKTNTAWPFIFVLAADMQCWAKNGVPP